MMPPTPPKKPAKSPDNLKTASGFPREFFFFFLKLLELDITAGEIEQISQSLELHKINPPMEPVSLEKFLKSRGRYTHKAFWKEILVMQGDKPSSIQICSDRAAITSFSDLYAQITPKLEVN